MVKEDAFVQAWAASAAAAQPWQQPRRSFLAIYNFSKMPFTDTSDGNSFPRGSADCALAGQILDGPEKEAYDAGRGNFCSNSAA